ncbi:hypothetical protein ACHAWO_013533 [Cyclotella atomus]|uniref:Uncharacterized protein n=1 Tax=Cyclotella atomus TaxID=382360 RepID=A0ABD3PSN3_9STRA
MPSARWAQFHILSKQTNRRMESPQIEDDERSAASRQAPSEEDAKVEVEEDLQMDDDVAAEENGGAEEAAGIVEADGSMGPFEKFFINTNNVSENKRLPYIMMLFGALGYDIEEIYPYNEILKDTTNALGGGGWKRSLKPTKDMIANEILRQNPNAKLNIKNIKIDEFIQRVQPLTDPRDVAFIVKEEQNIRRRFYELLGADFSQDAVINKDVVAKPRTVVPVRSSEKRPVSEIDDGIVDQYKITPKNKRVKSFGVGQTPKGNVHQWLFPPSFTLSTQAAEQTMHAAAKFSELHGNDWSVSIVMVDTSGVPVCAKRMDGAPPSSYDIALGRAKNAVLFNKSTSQIEGEKSGGCPIFIGGVTKCIGAIGVAGDTSANDEKIAKYGVSYISNLFSPSLPMP